MILKHVPTGSGKLKSVRRKRDIQGKSKRIVVDEVLVGQKEETVRTSNFIILG